MRFPLHRDTWQVGKRRCGEPRGKEGKPIVTATVRCFKMATDKYRHQTTIHMDLLKQLSDTDNTLSYTSGT